MSSDQSFKALARRRHPRARPGRIAALAGCALVLLSGGCGRGDDESALSDAKITLSSLDVGVGTRMPEGVSAKSYNEVIQSLQELAGEDGPLSADASVLISSAQRGLGLHGAAEAADLERQAQNMLPGIRARLRAWQMHSAGAEAAATYDPAPELARIDAAVRARQEEAERERAEKASIEARRSELLNQVADRLARASALRDQAGSLELQIPRVSATEGLGLAEQIRTLTRQADALEFEARDLKNQADALGLDVQASEVELDKLSKQIEILGDSRAAVQENARASQDAAARARGDAEQAAAEIAQRVDTGENALTPFRRDQVEPAAERAFKQFQTATANAKRGLSARRSHAQIAVGEAQQSLGDAQWTRALGLGSYAQLMEEMASVEPALPSAAEYASRAEDAKTRAVEAKQAAFDAYQAAKSAYESTGASGEAGERLDQVTTRLNEISREVGKGVVDAAALSGLEEGAEAEATDETPEEPMSPEEAEPAAGADPESELRAAIQAALDAQEAGDVETALSFLHPATDEDVGYVETLGDLARAAHRLDQATEEAFGLAFSDWIKEGADPVLAQIAAMAATDMDVDSLDIRVQGDEAVALTGNAMQPEVKFLRVDGEWKQVVDITAQSAENPMLAAGFGALGQVISMFNELADGVEAGDLDSNAAVGNALKSKLMQAPGGG